MNFAVAGAVILAGVLTVGARAESINPIRIWNLTASTIIDFRLAKAGTQAFGPNLTLEDHDKTIEVDERLKLPKLAPGVYDAKLTLRDGRTCRLQNLSIEASAIVSIEEKDLRDCAK